jgi:hypothetical protein
MFRLRISDLILTASLALMLRALGADPATQESQVPCYVFFEFHENGLESWYRSYADLQSKIAISIAEKLKEKIPYWAFQFGDSNSYPRLKIWVEKTTAWNIRMSIEPTAHAGGQAHWIGVLWSPEEVNQMAGFPAQVNLPKEIAERFDQNVMGENTSKIEEAVRQSVPLVRAEVSLGSMLLQKTKPVHAVLPLNWNEYRDLGEAKFRVVCKWPKHSRVELYSHSTKQCAQFAGSTGSFDAVEVEEENNSIEQHSAHLAELIVNEIYLQEHKWEPTFDCDEPSPDTAPLP